jgi:hypothetical protein
MPVGLKSVKGKVICAFARKLTLLCDDLAVLLGAGATEAIHDGCADALFRHGLCYDLIDA